MRTKILGLTIIALLLLTPIAFPVYAEDTSPEPPETPPNSTEDANSTLTEQGNVTDPQVVLDLLAQANASRLVLMAALSNAYGENYSLYERGENLTEGQHRVSFAAMNNQMHGDDAIDKALRFMDEDSLTAAAQQVKRAMKQYRNALRKAYHDNPEAMKNFESENVTEPDPPPPDEPDVNETEIMEAKLMLIQQFQENFRERVMSMEENVNSLMNQLSDKDSQKAGDALERTERKLLRIQERLNRGDVDGAMEDLENATDGMDEALDGFEDDHTAQMLRTMDKLEARVQRMVDKMNRKAARGMDTSGDEDAINQAWGQIKKFQEDFQSGKSGSAPGQNKDNGNGQGNGKGNGNGKGHDKPDKEK
jgi:hypothetical protein